MPVKQKTRKNINIICFSHYFPIEASQLAKIKPPYAAFTFNPGSRIQCIRSQIKSPSNKIPLLLIFLKIIYAKHLEIRN